jgi:hypothetical protein
MMMRPRLHRFFCVFLLAVATLFALTYFPLLRTRAANPGATILPSAGKPLVNLKNPQTLNITYTGAATAVSALQGGTATPVSLAAADFNSDGAMDVVAGYSTANGGVLAVFRGNLSAYAPSDPTLYQKAMQGSVPNTFLSKATVFTLPESPDLLVTGDFNHDGKPDVLIASRGGSLYFLAGDGTGNLLAPVVVPVLGQVRALAVAGDSHVAVSLESPSGDQLTILSPTTEGLTAGATYSLPARGDSVAWGNFGGGTDIAVGAGANIDFIYNPLTKNPQTETVTVPFTVEGLTLGDYIWDRDGRTEIAALADDGSIQILQHGTLNTDPITAAELSSRRAAIRTKSKQSTNPTALGAWTVAKQLSQTASAPAGPVSPSAFNTPRLAAATTHDVMILDAGKSQLNILDTSGKAASPSAGVSFSSAPIAALALPQKINASRDIVVLTSSQSAPMVVTANASLTLTVTTTADIDTANACTNSSVTSPPSPLSLREAVCVANNNAPDTVTINIGPGTYDLTSLETGELQIETSGTGYSLFIVGTGTTANTVIQQTDGDDRIFEEDFGISGNNPVSISNVTLTGGNCTNDTTNDCNFGGGAILAGSFPGDDLTLTNVVLSNNSAGKPSDVAAGGAVNFGGPNMTVTSSTFSGNSCDDEGAAFLFTDSADTSGNLVVTNSTFTSNVCTNTGAVSLEGASGTSATISGSTFTGNKATEATFGSGGAIKAGANVGYSLTVSNSRITGNSAAQGSGVYIESDPSPAAALINNWWGCNGGPGASGCDTVFIDPSDGSQANFNPWLVLGISAASTQINPNASTGVTATIDTNSSGGTGFSVPNGTAISFGATLGTISGASASFTSGQATATFNSGSTTGAGSATATVDSQEVSVTINIGAPPAITSANNTTFVVGTPGSFTVTTTGSPTPSLSESGTLPIGISFTDNGNGTGTLSGTPAAGTGGTYGISFTAQNGVSPNATQSFTLTVDQSPVITSANSTTFNTGIAGTFTITTTAFPTASISESGTLPTGVSFVDNHNGTGTLSGTPTQGGSFPITFTASNGVGSNAVQSFTLTVGQAPAITSANSTTFVVGTAGTFTVTTTGSPTPSISESGTLPTGVSFVDNHNGTGTLSGTPTVSGTFGISFTASNGVGSNAVQSFTLTVDQAPAITSANSATFNTGTAGTFTVTTTGFPTASISESGTLPTGVSFDDNHNGTGTLSGTPTQGGSFPITFTASNGVGSNAVQSFTLTVGQAPAITSANDTTFVVSTAGTFTVTTTGSPTPSISESGTLPTGVSFVDNHNGTGTLSGTPTASGTFSISFTASNGVGSNAVQSFTLTVNQSPAITSANSAAFNFGSANSFTVTTTGFPTPSLSESGALPTGVTFVDNHNGTGTLSGTPTQGGTFPITFTASNGVGSNAVQSFTLSIGQPSAITSGNSTTFIVGSAGTFTVTTTGSPTPSLSESGTLPSGVTFVDNHNGTGTLSGTASISGVFGITFTASNGVGSNAVQSFTLTVDQAPAITSTNSATFTLGAANSFTLTSTGFPTPSLSESGALPTGVTFIDNHNGTGTLSGTPTSSETFPIMFTASNGVGSPAVQSFTLTVSGPQLSVSPTSINFGTVYLFSVLTHNVSVKNIGTAAVTFSSLSLTLGSGTNKDDFAFVNFCPKTLAAGKSCDITVFFFAGNVGSPSATLKLADNAPGSPQQVSMSATVINPLPSFNPAFENFGAVKVGNSATREVTLANVGSTALNITSIGVTGANPGDFIEGNACPSSLAPGGNCMISVTFMPSKAGQRSASLTVVDNAIVGTQNIPLSGRGD